MNLAAARWTFDGESITDDGTGRRLASLSYRARRGAAMSVPSEDKQACGALMSVAPELRRSLVVLVRVLQLLEGELSAGEREALDHALTLLRRTAAGQ